MQAESSFKRLTDLVEKGEVKGKRVFIRSDLNVPRDADGNITEDTRIRASIPAIQAALSGGAAVMVTSHLGRPKEGVFSETESLSKVAIRMGELLGQPVELVRDWTDGVNVQPGQVVLLENARFNVGEKKNSEDLSRKIAALCDIYVNDAFGTAHRAEATTHGAAQFAGIACAGPLMAAELDALQQATATPNRPMLAIVGGAKVSGKLEVLKKLSDKVDNLIIGGGIANTFLLAAGLPVGKSLVEEDLVEEAKTIMAIMKERGASVPLPVDVVCAKEFAASAPASIKKVSDVEADDMILDIGPETSAQYAQIIANAGTVVWNGPVGVFEFDQFESGTKAVSQAIADSKAFSLAGGGDTLAAIAKYNIGEKVGYISTGGGAFLEFLEGKILPAVGILMQRANS